MSLPLPPPVIHHPPLLDVHVADETEVHSVLFHPEAETVLSHPAPAPEHLAPGYSGASLCSSASRHSVSFRSVDTVAIKPCTDYSQYGPWLHGQFSDCLPKGVQYLIGPSLLNINSPIQESVYHVLSPKGFLDILGPKFYDENLAELT